MYARDESSDEAACLSIDVTRCSLPSPIYCQTISLASIIDSLLFVDQLFVGFLCFVFVL